MSFVASASVSVSGSLGVASVGSTSDFLLELIGHLLSAGGVNVHVELGSEGLAHHLECIVHGLDLRIDAVES